MLSLSTRSARIQGLVLAICSLLMLAQPARAGLNASLSGIRGRAVLPGCGWQGERYTCTNAAYRTTIHIRGLTRRHISSVRTDSAGFFQTHLRPGRYELTATTHYIEDGHHSVIARAVAPTLQVTVRKRPFTSITVSYSYDHHFFFNPTLLRSTNAPRRFVVTDLSSLLGGIEVTRPAKINNNGDVVGSTLIEGTWVPFLYRNGIMTRIEGFPGDGYARDINDSGAIVGYFEDPYRVPYILSPFLYQHGITTDLSLVIGRGWANDINNSGQIIGSGHNTNFFSFLLDESGLHSLNITAYDINNSGQIVGSIPISEIASHAAIFEDGQVRDLGTLPGDDDSSADAINDRGLIVGSSIRSRTNAMGISRAFAYSRGHMLNIGVLPGFLHSAASDVNDAGWVIGEAYHDGDGVPRNNRPFLWVAGRLYDLNALIPRGSAWKLFSASSINDCGQIMGWAIVNGKARAYLLTPVQ